MIYTCPKCGKEFRSEVAGVVICPSCGEKVEIAPILESGNAWDTGGKGRWFQAFFETIKRSLIDPIKFFEEVSRGAGYIRPWFYAVIISFIVFASAAAYQAGFQALAISTEIANSISTAVFPLMAFSVPVTVLFILIGGVIGVPIITTVFLIIQSGIYHLCLMILGSAKRDYTTTFRVICYASGPQIFQIVPFFGGFVGPVWQIVLAIIGLKVAHRTTYGRSVLAVFLPTLVCCGLFLMIIVAVAGGVVASLATGGGG